ncbi:MAG: hypothetical protein IAE94_06720 [Chthoniobacterales bacterium]|nr:hypothetical protein [Chthoniobacterales bacterium]
MPQFTPRPANNFQEFIDTYYTRCRALAPEIVGQAGKWKFEDLIPGLSDFDTRFLTVDGLKAADWIRLSMVVGQVHLDLSRERPDWARTLEHLPGVNLTVEELLDPENYYPEFSQWTFYQADTKRLRGAASRFANTVWTDADTTYHWKRIALYYERYNRTIDPPINLGTYESKYPLHSRYMHYLAPPLHSAVCLMERRTTPGKLDAFRRARDLFPRAEVMNSVLAGIENHYETPETYGEPALTELDIRLEAYLLAAIDTLLPLGDLDCAPAPTPARLRAAVSKLPQPGSLSRMFENIKFARLMKGRLWFYSHELPWFDSIPLIQVELNRIGRNFLELPLEIFSENILEKKLRWDVVLRELGAFGFSADEVALCHTFHSLADPGIPRREYRSRARELVGIYTDFLHIIEKLSNLTSELLAAREYPLAQVQAY